MTTKPTFSRLSTLVNGVSNMNAIITQIETAFQNTLSRDGSTPNQMTATLDMNANRIINLPTPLSSNEPVRLTDIVDVLGYEAPGSAAGYVTKRQFFAAVAALANMNLLYQAIPADANNAVWIEFQAARTTYKTGSLALLAKSTFGWTDAQLTICFDLAATLAP